MEFPYTRICGRLIHFPPLFSIVQVSCSFHFHQAYISRVLLSPNPVIRDVKVIPNVGSKQDAEWLGLLAGVEYALENGEHAVALEYSNPDIIQGLIIPGTRFYRHSISQHKQQILATAQPLDWLGARVISSRHNRAINSQLY
jgi:hypothetical protein